MTSQSSVTQTGQGILAGQVAVVTGGAKGIGLRCARVLGQAVASVGIVDVDAAACEAGVQELRSLGVTAEAYLCDVGRKDQVDLVIAAVVDRFGRLDVVVANGTN